MTAAEALSLKRLLRMEDWGHVDGWTPEQVAEWKRAYAADEPVLLPHAEHEDGDCDHCDLLRHWMAEIG